MDKWRKSEFFDHEDDPLTPMANLVDIILVFACGLIAALVSLSPDLQQHFAIKKEEQVVTTGKEITQAPDSLKSGTAQGQGYESMGQVYKDPKTGKLILISP